MGLRPTIQFLASKGQVPPYTLLRSHRFICSPKGASSVPNGCAPHRHGHPFPRAGGSPKGPIGACSPPQATNPGTFQRSWGLYFLQAHSLQVNQPCPQLARRAVTADHSTDGSPARRQFIPVPYRASHFPVIARVIRSTSQRAFVAIPTSAPQPRGPRRQSTPPRGQS